MTRRVVQIVAALVRRDGSLLLVRQAAPGEEPFWSLPAGRVEEGELAGEALVRELDEEAGLAIVGDPVLAFSTQVDDPADGYVAAVWTFEVEAGAGTPAPRDPDGLVLEAAFVPVEEAASRLLAIEWQAPTVAYLRGELTPGSLCLCRRSAGRLAIVAAIAPARGA